ncbi:hypothetical protein, conserved [Eimeria tenella]|uniref:Translation initiation factor 3 C-terminal domain-containing protein n=1 Tax=Eimeria tenella TaxID=5802 RepID=U6KSQ1_EIMTE|nr:hypothetical protein, conserved [Eimeria tenella]CDJ39938.1 hypothetical protein, conserved [Eimeria tenella]|eukprot:XP_013230691.1 hypothetical protein, conserved [Eimeria tenella]
MKLRVISFCLLLLLCCGLCRGFRSSPGAPSCLISPAASSYTAHRFRRGAPLGAPKGTLAGALGRLLAGPFAGDPQEYLKLRNTVENLSDFEGGQQMLQQMLQRQEGELQQHQHPEFAAANYSRARALRAKASKQPRKKEIKLSARIAVGDLQQKARQARVFLEGKHQVKFTLQLRGRERFSPENHLPLLQQLQQLLQDVGQPAAAPQAKGPCSVLTLFLQPKKKHGRAKANQQQQQRQQQTDAQDTNEAAAEPQEP